MNLDYALSLEKGGGAQTTPKRGDECSIKDIDHLSPYCEDSVQVVTQTKRFRMSLQERIRHIVIYGRDNQDALHLLVCRYKGQIRKFQNDKSGLVLVLGYHVPWDILPDFINR